MRARRGERRRGGTRASPVGRSGARPSGGRRREAPRSYGFRAPLAVALFLPLLLLAAGSPLAAQRAELIPQIGFFTGLSSLGTAEDEEGGRFVLGERERGFAYGVAVEFGRATPAGVRAAVLFGRGSDIPVVGPGCEVGDCVLDNNVRALTGALVLRPLPSLVLLRPYLLVGAGWKRFGFDETELEELGLEAAIGDQTKGAWQIGAGVELGLGVTSVVLEVSDFVSGFTVEEDRGDGKTQHDLFLTVGLRL